MFTQFQQGLVKFLMLMVCVTHAQRDKRGVCSTRSLAIPNGTYRLGGSNAYVVYKCNRGYFLYGVDQINCIGTKWAPEAPKCLINNCPPLSPIPNSNMTSDFEGALVTFDCNVNYRIVGASKLLCPGEQWSDTPPTCEKWTPPQQCDFEDSYLCGWTHHDYSDVQWRWNSGTTGTRRTGPDHDHTLGPTGNGHYMYFETSSPTAPNHRAILISPKYSASKSRDACFSFWYHIYGRGKIGNLQVFFKSIDDDLSHLKGAFYVNEDKGTDWQFENLTMPLFNTTFQIVFMATRSTSFKSDFAIDDVNLVTDCLWNPTRNDTTTTTPATTTTKTTTTKTTTVKPTTVAVTTTITVPTTTIAPSTPSVTSSISVTSSVSTTSNITATGQRNSTFDDQTRSTLNPIINPHVKEARGDSQSAGNNSLFYILLGVGFVIAIVAVLVVAFICYRRRTRQGVSISAVNPVYTSVHEENVCFIEDDGYDKMYL